MRNGRFFSAPGRVEIGGNHTDHQHGRVLAAAVNLEKAAVANLNGSNIINIHSVQYGAETIDVTSVDVREEEKGKSISIVRGVASWFKNNGYAVGGFDAEMTSTVPSGSGLSSSASYEVLLGNIFKGLFNSDISKIEIAKAGQYAENVYFGKPCGLMDQTASSFGGLNMIDFQDPDNPVITPVRANFHGHSMCVVITGGTHEDLTPDYAAILSDMKAVATYFGKKYLREVQADDFFSSIGRIRKICANDRSVLRAIHFFGENERTLTQVSALNRNDLNTFYELVIESGRSSLSYLQNAYSTTNTAQQGLTLALALSEKILSGRGAWRVNGGGFAGTILAFVPNELIAEYSRQMSGVFGDGCCLFLSVRDKGGGETKGSFQERSNLNNG